MLTGIIKIKPEKLGTLRFGKLIDPQARVMGPSGTHIRCRRYEVMSSAYPAEDFTLLVPSSVPQRRFEFGAEIKAIGTHVVAIPSGIPIGTNGINPYYDCFTVLKSGYPMIVQQKP